MRCRLLALVAPLLLTACHDPNTLASPDSAQVSSTAPARSPGEPMPGATAKAAEPATTAPLSTPVPPASTDEATKFAKSNNAFGSDMYRAIAAAPGNLAFSPTSLSIALAMTWGGAKGETAAQMKKVLHFEGTPADVMTTSGKLVSMLEGKDRSSKVAIANRLFGERTYKFEQPFLDATKKAYGAALEPVDFIGGFEPARATINGWVESRTERRIKGLIPSGGVDADSRLVLVNAVHFLADWEQPFDKAATYDASFTVSANDTKKVPTMHGEGSFALGESDGTKLLTLPYKGGEMSMLIALPKAADALPALEQKVSPHELATWDKAMKPARVRVGLPKFEINPAASLDLGDTLMKLGMPLALSRGADFSGLANPAVNGDKLHISRVFHKAFVRVDEKGTEAAAASAVVMSDEGAPAEANAEFNADRPFLFFIRDNKTGLVLFMGRVGDPSAK